MQKLLILFLFTFLFSQAEITNIQASQRTDGSQIVDITYDLLPDPIFEFFEIIAWVSFDGGENYVFMNYVDGDIGDIIEPGNEKTLTWNFGTQFSETYSDQIKIKIEGSSYAIIDNGGNQELPFEMVTIPAGSYTSGENNEMLSIDYDYEIMKYEVTDLDYVLFMMDKLAGNTGGNTDECQDTHGSATDSYGDGCSDYTQNPTWCGNYDDNDFNSDLMCCGCGGGSGVGGYDVTVTPNHFTGYYSGDAINPAGFYQLIHFSNSKISWNGDIFEVQEGHVNHPVTGVTWFGAWAFATHYGMQVPTNDEWEKAARGDTGYNYPFGDDMTYQMANFNSDSTQNSNLPWNLFDVGSNNTTPVGMYDGRTLDIDCLSIVPYSCVYETNMFEGSVYGDCDQLWVEYNITCSELESNYDYDSFNCVGCECPGDGDDWEDSDWEDSDWEDSWIEQCSSMFPDDAFITIDSPSAYGLYDMAGNVREIVHNGNASQYYTMGGHWNSSLLDCQSWQKQTINANHQDDLMGFRCLRRTIERSSQENSNKKKEKIINQNKMIKQLKKVKK